MSDPATVPVVFRYDDCSAKSSLTLEQAFVQAFARCGAEVTMGVIPCAVEGAYRDPSPQALMTFPADKAAWLRSASTGGHLEVALHGYSHQRAAG